MSKEQHTHESDCMSPGELAKEVGVRPQMIYNYISAGRIEAFKCEEHERWCILLLHAQTWINKRVAKEEAKYESIQKQLKGG